MTFAKNAVASWAGIILDVRNWTRKKPNNPFDASKLPHYRSDPVTWHLGNIKNEWKGYKMEHQPDAPMTLADAADFARNCAGRLIVETSAVLDTMPRGIKIGIFTPLFLAWMGMVMLFGFADFLTF